MYAVKHTRDHAIDATHSQSSVFNGFIRDKLYTARIRRIDIGIRCVFGESYYNAVKQKQQILLFFLLLFCFRTWRKVFSQALRILNLWVFRPVRILNERFWKNRGIKYIASLSKNMYFLLYIRHFQ